MRITAGEHAAQAILWPALARRLAAYLTDWAEREEEPMELPPPAFEDALDQRAKSRGDSMHGRTKHEPLRARSSQPHNPPRLTTNTWLSVLPGFDGGPVRRSTAPADFTGFCPRLVGEGVHPIIPGWPILNLWPQLLALLAAFLNFVAAVLSSGAGSGGF